MVIKMNNSVYQFSFYADRKGICELIDIDEYENPYCKNGKLYKYIQDKINKWLSIKGNSIHIQKVR